MDRLVEVGFQGHAIHGLEDVAIGAGDDVFEVDKVTAVRLTERCWL